MSIKKFGAGLLLAGLVIVLGAGGASALEQIKAKDAYDAVLSQRPPFW